MEDKICINIELRPAVKHDFITPEGYYKANAVYFLKSMITGKFDKKIYYLDLRPEQKAEFLERYKAKMVYVAKHPFDYEIEETT